MFNLINISNDLYNFLVVGAAAFALLFGGIYVTKPKKTKRNKATT